MPRMPVRRPDETDEAYTERCERCRLRNNERCRAWRAAHPERVREHNRRYVEAHKEAIKAYQHTKYTERYEKIRDDPAYKARRHENSLKFKASHPSYHHDYYITHKDEHRRRCAEYRKRQGPDYKEKERYRNSVYYWVHADALRERAREYQVKYRAEHGNEIRIRRLLERERLRDLRGRERKYAVLAEFMNEELTTTTMD